MFDKIFKKKGETKNITPKVFAIILAIVLWLYVMNEQNPPFETSFLIPLEVRNAVTSQVILDVPETVKIRVRGPRTIVAGLLIKDLKAFIDVKGLEEGRQNIKVGAAIPSSLEVVEIDPDRVQIRVDTTVTRQIPVETRLTGAPAPGTVIGKANAANESVTIEGPKNVLATVEKVVAVVDLSGKSQNIAIDARLVPINRAGKEIEGITIYPEKTNVTVNLITAVNKKMLEVKPVTYGELPQGLVVKSIVTQPDKVVITETVPGKGVDKLEAVYTELVNLADIRNNTDKEVKLQLPEGMTGMPGSVIVTIKVGPR